MDRSQPPIYLDHCATTPCAPEVIEAMYRALREVYGNSGSTHQLGWRARTEIENARSSLARLFSVRPKTLTFTSGATESNQLAIFGVGSLCPRSHIITQVSEHKAVLDPIKQLEMRGHSVTCLQINSDGLISLEELREAIRPETRLISIMHVNNELGVIQPIQAIGELIRASSAPGCFFHVDGAQSVGKIPVDLSTLEVDLFSLSAHKFYGPKGVGALYVRQHNSHRERLTLPPLFFGGGQERGLRPGTPPTHQLIGMGVAAELAKEGLASGEEEYIRALKNELWSGLTQRWPTIKQNGASEYVISGVLSVQCPADMIDKIEEELTYLAYSRGAACHSEDHTPSHVLTSLGCSAQEAHHTLRFCVGRYNTQDEIETILSALR